MNGVIETALQPDLVVQFRTDNGPQQLKSRQLSGFRGMKGAVAGSTSPIFYVSYVFYEKKCVAANAVKSKHRKDMESIWASRGGFNLSTMAGIATSAAQGLGLMLTTTVASL
jgi:hypothetical protein